MKELEIEELKRRIAELEQEARYSSEIRKIKKGLKRFVWMNVLPFLTGLSYVCLLYNWARFTYKVFDGKLQLTGDHLLLAIIAIPISILFGAIVTGIYMMRYTKEDLGEL